MCDNKRSKTLLIGLVLAVASWLGAGSALLAQDLTLPSRVVDSYLAGLASGDTAALSSLIDGTMKQKNRHLLLSPETYAQFLREHYAGVQMTVEDVVPEGDAVRARVRFDYGAGQSSVIEFLLTQADGQWKITDEVF
jgi:predicted ester cyclase